ncbi:MAG: 3-phosphoshikimate 1-carboxyvinyltransferase [Deltaproteobacteria bacterium]|nr:3-phosphoshikimate 1-carboxyvinyltransferase [Candidatus Zymogenaceae bacterium]
MNPAAGLRGDIVIPGDKSVSHRSVIFAAQAEGTTRITNFLPAADTRATADIMRALGTEINEEGKTLVVEGRGMRGFTEPAGVLDCGNSGTSMRLLAGLLSARPFFSVLAGDASLTKRPMRRVTAPLREMGATIQGRDGGQYPPLAISGGNLTGITYDLPISSAQVKSAILLAGMLAGGETRVSEPAPSRDHTERMMAYLDIPLAREGSYLVLEPVERYRARDIEVVGDISSAAFFIVAALITKDSEITIRNVGMNPGRTGIIEALVAMGADIAVENEREISGEPAADLTVRSSELSGTDIGGAIIPRMIDEIPVFCVAAAAARGTTTVRDAGELAVKESNRIKTTCANLRALGGKAEDRPDGMIVDGTGGLPGGGVASFGDHRTAMSAAVAGLASDKGVTVADLDCVGTSFPSFFDLLDSVTIS